MKSVLVPALLACLALGACADPQAVTEDRQVEANRLPDEVRALAAPGQNLGGVRLLADDGCYWYRHAGPVETTYVPLRSIEGRPICSRPQ